MADQRHPDDPRLHYAPIERPCRYPLELDEKLRIFLWEPDGECKWTIADWIEHAYGWCLRFAGDRPLDERVNWQHFRELVVQGQGIADRRFRDKHGEEKEHTDVPNLRSDGE